MHGTDCVDAVESAERARARGSWSKRSTVNLSPEYLVYSPNLLLDRESFGVAAVLSFPPSNAALLILLADTTIHRCHTLSPSLSLPPRPPDQSPAWQPRMMWAPRPGSPMSPKAGLLQRLSRRTLTERRSRSFSSWPMERYAHYRSS